MNASAGLDDGFSMLTTPGRGKEEETKKKRVKLGIRGLEGNKDTKRHEIQRVFLLFIFLG